jgi:hypothetical protein
MIPKSGCRFSEKIMLKKELERDDDSQISHTAPGTGDDDRASVIACSRAATSGPEK